MTRKLANKRPFVKEVAEKTGITFEQALFVYDVIFDRMVNKLRDGCDFVFPGVGIIKMIDVPSTISHLTGQTIPPHKRIKFVPNIKLARYIRVKTREYKIV
jgi:nucleoid DNA-binding protein